MASTTWQILPAPDEVILDALGRVSNELGAGTYTVVLAEQGNSRHLSGQLGDLPADNPFEQFRGEGLTLAKTVSFQIADPVHPRVSFSLTRQAGVDQVTVHISDQAEPTEALRVLSSIKRAFKAYDRTNDIDRALSPALADFHRLREASLQRLEEAQLRLIEQSVEHRSVLDQEAGAHRARLENEFRAREEQLEAAMRTREHELARREDALATERSALDDRKSTHARRKLREDLLEKIKQRNASFTLSKDTDRKRLPVHAVFISLLAASAASAIHTALGADINSNWVAALRFILSAITFTGTAFFYIRWNDDWARRHAAEEFRLRRMELDVDRASWVVEMLLEWKEEKEGAPPPAELLVALTKGMFQEDGRADDRARHPAEDLANAILGASNTVELNLGGNRLILDRKGIKKLGTQSSDGT